MNVVYISAVTHGDTTDEDDTIPNLWPDLQLDVIYYVFLISGPTYHPMSFIHDATYNPLSPIRLTHCLLYLNTENRMSK